VGSLNPAALTMLCAGHTAFADRIPAWEKSGVKVIQVMVVVVLSISVPCQLWLHTCMLEAHGDQRDSK